jgi:hypothetical protein
MFSCMVSVSAVALNTVWKPPLLLNPMYFFKHALNCEQNFSFLIFWSELTVTRLTRVYCTFFCISWLWLYSWRYSQIITSSTQYFIIFHMQHCTTCFVPVWTSTGIFFLIQLSSLWNLRSLHWQVFT